MTLADVFTLPVDAEIKQKTAQNTAQKFLYTHPSMMYKRTPIQILDNIYMGDLAKNALLAYLRSNCINPIQDYDEIRTDGFQKPDPSWDYKVGKRRIKLEVKSSIPPRNETQASLIQNRDIKITASHDKGRTWLQPEKLESEIHTQIFFYAKPCKTNAATHQEVNNMIQDTPEAVHQFLESERYNEPLFFGWTTKKSIIQCSRQLEPATWTFEKTSRIYWRCPIKEAFTLPFLIDTVDIF
jgi:hypothetical protein